MLIFITNIKAQDINNNQLINTRKWSVSLLSYGGISEFKVKYNRDDSVKFGHGPYYNYGFSLLTNFQYSPKTSFETGINHISNAYNKDINEFAIFAVPTNEPLDEYLNTIRIHHLNIPFNIKFSLTRNNRLNFGIGTYYGFYLGSSRKVYYYDKPEFMFINETKYKSDFGFTTSLQYNIRVSERLYLPLLCKYNLGVKNINLHEYEDMKNRSTQIGFGIMYKL